MKTIMNGHEVDKRFLMRLNLQQFAEDGRDAGSSGEQGGAPADDAGNGGEQPGADKGADQGGTDAKALAAMIEQLKADMAK